MDFLIFKFFIYEDAGILDMFLIKKKKFSRYYRIVFMKNLTQAIAL